MKNKTTFRLAQQQFTKGQPNIVITGNDWAGLKALDLMGGQVRSPAALAKALTTDGDPDSRHALQGGRLLRRLENFGYVQQLPGPEGGFEITPTGRTALTQMS
ncbi:hypothetical protein ABH908_000514 [Pseudomonas frederiksbergensis]|uniref:hypothetical protein n=1 Tax=Pseudomonas TaxID=286 RepID=UPI003D22AAE0